MIKSKILSLNSGVPTLMEWKGKSVKSSMLRHPVPGPLVVHKDHIEGNSFEAPHFHGLEHSVLYAYGMKSALSFVQLLGETTYAPGSVGENVTLDDLDETQISAGDIFQFGEVLAQAVLPRIPCGKVNIRMKHSAGQKSMQDCGRSGVYFRILKPGKIHFQDQVTCIEHSQHRFLISDLYKKLTKAIPFTQEEISLAQTNGVFPKNLLEKWTQNSLTATANLRQPASTNK